MGADPPQTPEQKPPSGQDASQAASPTPTQQPVTRTAPPKHPAAGTATPAAASGAKTGPSQARPRPQQSGQPRSASGQRPPTKPKYGENKNRASEYAAMPFVFVSFMFGLANMGAVPVIYVYEIIKNNQKDEWPAWSGLDGLNYLFFSKNPLFVRGDLLYHIGPQSLPVLALDLHIPAVTKFLNSVAVTYLDMAVAFVCFLQGVIFLWLSVRIAIRALDKPAAAPK